MYTLHQKQSKKPADEKMQEPNCHWLFIEDFKIPVGRGLEKGNRWPVSAFSLQ
jgi:hypothetical protein